MKFKISFDKEPLKTRNYWILFGVIFFAWLMFAITFIVCLLPPPHSWYQDSGDGSNFNEAIFALLIASAIAVCLSLFVNSYKERFKLNVNKWTMINAIFSTCGIILFTVLALSATWEVGDVYTYIYNIDGTLTSGGVAILAVGCVLLITNFGLICFEFLKDVIKFEKKPKPVDSNVELKSL